MDKIKNLLPLNWELMGNPFNWAVVVLMVLAAGLGLALIASSTTKAN